MDDLLQYLTEDVKQNISEAVNENRIHFIEKDGIAIGFHTWEENNGKIFINNLWIKKEYRNKDNLFSLRKFFRDMYPNKLFYWRNRKTKRRLEYD